MGNKLLLADDSITIQKVVGIIFANEDYELAVVDNGNAALDKARQMKPDVMLVDALMPGKTGYEVCEEVRRDPDLQQTPLLLLTGAFEPFDEEKARQSGADDYISKPFESQHLIDKVKQLIELGRERAVAKPVVAPAMAAAAVPTAEDIWAPAPEAPLAAALPADDLAEAFFAAEEAGEVVPEALPVTGAMGAGGPADDLWGTFELEAVDEGEAVAFAEPVEPAAAGYADELEVEEAFSFAEEEEAGVVETGVEIGAVAPSAIGSQWIPEGEQTFSFEEEPGAAGLEAIPEVAQFAVEAAEPFAEPFAEVAEPFTKVAESFAEVAEPAALSVFAAEVPLAAPAAPAMELQFAPEEEYVPVVPAPAAAPAADATHLSEVQLAAIVSRISKELIERIAWEVVPDLAEALIKEEIRKIREGS